MPTLAAQTAQTPRSRRLRLNLEDTKFSILSVVQQKLNWRDAEEGTDWDVAWLDSSVNITRVMRLRPNQRINHFVGMMEICRKKALARNMATMATIFPKLYKFTPVTLSLPHALDRALAKLKGGRDTFIIKPDASSQGKGIRLVQTGEQLQAYLHEMASTEVVMSDYIARPLLLRGCKFDLRIYVLVASCDPLRIYIYQQGLVRLCTQRYELPKANNLHKTYMHITNYAVNKLNRTGDEHSSGMANSTKWALADLWEYMAAAGHDMQPIWERIEDLVVLSLLAIVPQLKHQYCMARPQGDPESVCFELLGYDVLVDEHKRPWLLEVNHSPSFTTDMAVDRRIKEALLRDTLQLVQPDPATLSRRAARSASFSRPSTAGSPTRLSSSTASPTRPGSAFGRTVSTPLSTAAPADTAASPPDCSTSSSPFSRASEASAPETDATPASAGSTAQARPPYIRPCGSYNRIYPSRDPTAQARYERVLEAAEEVFQYSVVARTQKTLAKVLERRKQMEEEEAQKLAADAARQAQVRERARRSASLTREPIAMPPKPPARVPLVMPCLSLDLYMDECQQSKNLAALLRGLPSPSSREQSSNQESSRQEASGGCMSRASSFPSPGSRSSRGSSVVEEALPAPKQQGVVALRGYSMPLGDFPAPKAASSPERGMQRSFSSSSSPAPYVRLDPARGRPSLADIAGSSPQLLGSYPARPRSTADRSRPPLPAEPRFQRPGRATSDALTCTCGSFGTCTACRAARARPSTAPRQPLTVLPQPSSSSEPAGQKSQDQARSPGIREERSSMVMIHPRTSVSNTADARLNGRLHVVRHLSRGTSFLLPGYTHGAPIMQLPSLPDIGLRGLGSAQPTSDT